MALLALLLPLGVAAARLTDDPPSIVLVMADDQVLRHTQQQPSCSFH
eukprot:COSAG04_NODE_1146_length_8079_cov_7.674687_9_plen_47_part_00